MLSFGDSLCAVVSAHVTFRHLNATATISLLCQFRIASQVIIAITIQIAEYRGTVPPRVCCCV